MGCVSAGNGLIKKIYGIDPLVCKKCGSKMKIVAFIMDPAEVKKILHYPTYLNNNWDSTMLNTYQNRKISAGSGSEFTGLTEQFFETQS